ncbi:M20/M25/M40 family metallo-hydrolase [Ilumatobacter nonamiensis]|uniref:M20/M25/M40 family metallo-hydrolase n=1 Tax=Ilumatobacter nonamiensis TaxID=467093 RepID=UPI00058BFE91|nr:M20/M25/M40 family metallo-hydrolase [Ilumatobacter nonamiensis]
MKRPIFVGGALVAAVAVLVGATPAMSAPDHQSSNNNNSQKLRAAVTVDGIQEHLAAFQSFADAGPGNRLSGNTGYEDSAHYVADRAAAAGLDVTVQEFEYDLGFLADWQAPILEVVGGPALVPGIAAAQLGGDFGSMFKSTAYGIDTTAPVWAIDLALDDPTTTTSGCEVSDFDGVPAGAIVVVQRGNCGIATKLFNAQDSGAAALVFISAPPGQEGAVFFNFDGIDIPTLGATFDAAVTLVDGVADGDTGQTARFRIDWQPGTYTTQNVIAETSGRDDNVVVVGAHLDSVGVGPGIQDNGTGSAAILEIAEQMKKVKPRNQVRFIWFGAEESGLLGSEFYVDSLTEDEIDDIGAMLNFDMIASPNFVRFVYDGDLSDSPPPPSGAPDGSAAIETLFVDYFDSQGLASEPTEFSGRSDYGPFIEVGIPAGGLFTGAEGIKTTEQAAIYGGTVGEQYDPCYHLGCDDLDNPSALALDQMGDAAAHAVISLAQSTQAVNGERGKGNFNTPPGHDDHAPTPLTIIGR